LIGDWTNTYVFTKSLAERLLKKLKPENFPLTILRPSIVGAANRDPIKGWIEGITAIAALILLCGVGVIRYIHNVGTNVGDVIPVDYVSDFAIIAGCVYANNKELTVIHCSSSY